MKRGEIMSPPALEKIVVKHNNKKPIRQSIVYNDSISRALMQSDKKQALDVNKSAEV